MTDRDLNALEKLVNVAAREAAWRRVKDVSGAYVFKVVVTYRCEANPDTWVAKAVAETSLGARCLGACDGASLGAAMVGLGRMLGVKEDGL